MIGRTAAAWGLACILAASCPAARAQGGDDAQQAIRATLDRWTEQFNARRAGGICDLFAADLRYDYHGFPERNHKAVCDLLHRSLADENRRYQYSLHIREIIVAGDVAVVRLVWTLHVSGKWLTAPVVTNEVGMDVFRRQKDGVWKIIRYIAYEAS